MPADTALSTDTGAEMANSVGAPKLAKVMSFVIVLMPQCSSYKGYILYLGNLLLYPRLVVVYFVKTLESKKVILARGSDTVLYIVVSRTVSVFSVEKEPSPRSL